MGILYDVQNGREQYMELADKLLSEIDMKRRLDGYVGSDEYYRDIKAWQDMYTKGTILNEYSPKEAHYG